MADYIDELTEAKRQELARLDEHIAETAQYIAKLPEGVALACRRTYETRLAVLQTQRATQEAAREALEKKASKEV